jgi:hypothetical protein
MEVTPMMLTQEKANETKPCDVRIDAMRIGGGVAVPVRCTRPTGHTGHHSDQLNGSPIDWETTEDVAAYDANYFSGNPEIRTAEILWRVKSHLAAEFRIGFPRRGYQQGRDKAVRTIEKLLAKNRQNRGVK